MPACHSTQRFTSNLSSHYLTFFLLSHSGSYFLIVHLHVTVVLVCTLYCVRGV